jgi:hypothetical protein
LPSFGVKLNGSPQDGQKPEGRPGRSPRDRPTGLPHLAQYRFSSGTSAVAITAVAGSACTIGVTSTRPPPNRRRREPVRELPVFPIDPVRVESAPVRDDGDVFSLARCRGVVPALAQVGGLFVLEAAFVPVLAPAPAAGAMPQVSQ